MKHIRKIKKSKNSIPPNWLFRAFLPSFFLFSFLSAQGYMPADPYYLLPHEKSEFNKKNMYTNLIRPYFIKSSKYKWFIRYNSEHYFNTGHPNQENMDVRYFGKGYGLFNSVLFGYNGEFISFSIEPYLLHVDDNHLSTISRPALFNMLNDHPRNFEKQGIKEFQFNMHLNNGIGVGFGNASMWWGPGMHSSLIMTNNTVGLPYLMFGTIKEYRKKSIGINMRIMVAEFRNNNDKKVYLSSLIGALTIYRNPQISVGISRNYLTGGMDFDFKWGRTDAAKLLFDGLLLENTKKDKFSWHDPWDQTIAGYLSMIFPESKIKIYFEAGLDDHRANIEDLKSQPDHTLATIAGFRKYGLFSNPNLLIGFEYINLIQSRTWHQRSAAPWYSKYYYDYSSFNFRRWGAHSGSDSDDLYIIFGYLSDKFAFIQGFNYERHGVVYKQPAEIKFEWRFDLRYNYNKWKFGIHYENELIEHLGFPDDNIYKGEITGVRKIKTLIIKAEYLIEY